MVRSCWAMTDNTSISILLNSSKQHQAPDCANPEKNLPIILKSSPSEQLNTTHCFARALAKSWRYRVHLCYLPNTGWRLLLHFKLREESWGDTQSLSYNEESAASYAFLGTEDLLLSPKLPQKTNRNSTECEEKYYGCWLDVPFHDAWNNWLFSWTDTKQNFNVIHSP